MLWASMRDLRWRGRRFVIGVGATAVLFGVTLVFHGLPASLTHETAQTLDDVGADIWFTSDLVSGPFTGASILPTERLSDVLALPGIVEAAPIITLRESIRDDGTETVILIGHEPGALGTPTTVEGRPVAGDGEAVIDTSISGIALGDHIEFGSRRLTVVGKTSGHSFTGGVPALYTSLNDAQDAVTRGLDLATAIVAVGDPTTAPDGLRAWTRAQVGEDLLRPAGRIVTSLDMVKYLLWVAAAGVIGSVVYLTTEERTPDLAVFKAIGVPTRSILLGTLLQAGVMAAASLLLGTAGAFLLAPLFPLPIVVPTSAIVATAAVATIITALTSVVTARAILAVDPVVAFGRG